jgi:hypothetical protein
MSINHFTTKGNSVIGIEDAGLVEQGYANEPLHLVCLCYGVPGLGETGAEVAKVIADLLNSYIRKEET